MDFLKKQQYLKQMHILYTFGKPFKSYMEKYKNFFAKTYFHGKKSKNTFLKFLNFIKIGFSFFQQFLNQFCIFHI